MKKIFLTIIGSSVIGLCALWAQQQDTTGTASESRSWQQDNNRATQDDRRDQNNPAWQQEGDRDERRNAYANEGMVIIEKNEIPESLKETLRDEKYAGWENGTIYHNTNTGEYVIAPRAYRFDGQGKEIEADHTDKSANPSGRDSRYNGQGDQPSPYQQGTDPQPQERQSGDDPSRSYRTNEPPADNSRDQSTQSQSGQSRTDETQPDNSGSGSSGNTDDQ